MSATANTARKAATNAMTVPPWRSGRTGPLRLGIADPPTAWSCMDMDAQPSLVGGCDLVRGHAMDCVVEPPIDISGRYDRPPTNMRVSPDGNQYSHVDSPRDPCAFKDHL